MDGLDHDPVLVTAYLSANPVATLTRLKCSNAEIERARRIARHRDTHPDPEDPVSVRRWMASVGAATDDLVRLTEADGGGKRLRLAVQAVRAAKAPLGIADLAVTGEDLLAAGVPKGPAMGATLRALLDHVLEAPADNVRERLLDLARAMGRK